MTKDDLYGSWKIRTFKATTGDQVSYPLGLNRAASSGFPNIAAEL